MPHLIRKQVFDVSAASKEQGNDLQDKFSRLFNTYLFRKMERLFDRLVPEDRMLRLERLEIDLGKLPYDWNDDEVADHIVERLEQQLSSILLHEEFSAPTPSEEALPHNERSLLELLEYFLLRGTLPWWAGKRMMDAARALEILVDTAPSRVRDLLVRIGAYAYVRARLAFQFSDALIRSVIRLLEPTEAEFIFSYHTEVIRIQRERQLVKAEDRAFSRSVWAFILDYLLVDRGTHFNRKEFVRLNLLGIAGNYNLGFHELLSLFAAALRTPDRTPANIDSLQTIISELAAEQLRPEQYAYGLDSPTPVPDTTDHEHGFLLLRHFLSSGSFPWWAPPWSADELAAFFAKAVGRTPAATKTLLHTTGRSAFTRQLLAKTFKEELLLALVTLVKPTNADFIADYVTETKAIHRKKPGLMGSAGELHEAVWQFIFDYLLADRGSEFNRQMFLQSNIRQLANRFNTGYTEMLAFFAASISRSYHSSPRHFTLFQELMVLQKEAASGQNPLDLREGTEPLHPPDKTHAESSLKNALYFWLKFGYFPWWAAVLARRSPAALLEELAHSSRTEAVLFLKIAGRSLATRKRLVYQVDESTLLRVFALLPSGEEFLAYYTHLAQLTRLNQDIRFHSASVPRQILLFSFWDTLIEGRYTQFRPRKLMSTFVLNLAAWSGMPVAKLVAAARNVPGLAAAFTAAGKGAPSTWEELSGHRVQEEIPDFLLAEWADHLDVEERIARRIGLSVRAATTTGDLAKEALQLLANFLATGHLPGEYKITSGYATNQFVKHLLLYLREYARAALLDLLSAEQYAAENILRVHELFSTPLTAAELEMSDLLAAALERDIVRYIRASGNISKSSRTLAQLIDRFLKGSVSAQTADVLRKLSGFSAASATLARYYGNDDAFRLLEHASFRLGWGAGTVPFIRSVHGWLAGLFSDTLDRDRFDHLFRTFIFRMIGGTVAVDDEVSFIRQLFRHIAGRNYALMMTLSALAGQTFRKKKTDAGTPAPLIAQLKAGIAPYSAERRFSEDLDAALRTTGALRQPDARTKKEADEELRLLKKELEAAQAEQEQEERKPDLPADDDKIFISNAGLVILHPFLTTYFSRLGMVEKGNFVSEESRLRAVHLLQYLAFGTTEHEEHELVLNKILCNIPIEAPVVREIEITDEEKKISGELLHAVIANWEKLKNTSAESFQASFLQRDGALTHGEEGWNLKVEKRGYDVLLQTLPWGLGMIKISWMPEFIVVEWT